MRSSGDGGGGPLDAVADMAATPPPAGPVLASTPASAPVPAAPVVVVTSTGDGELDNAEAHLLKVHSTGGLVHDGVGAGDTGLSNGTSSPLLTSLSVVDSLLMPMRASGDTRIVGSDVIAVADPFAFRHTYAKFVQAGSKRLQVGGAAPLCTLGARLGTDSASGSNTSLPLSPSPAPSPAPFSFSLPPLPPLLLPPSVLARPHPLGAAGL